ncbi:hypothetical protein WG66_011330 [Moniliophthora roreri]|nr:hypothetical protein WG66_011330 [Moniliophthora roreri]
MGDIMAEESISTSVTHADGVPVLIDAAKTKDSPTSPKVLENDYYTKFLTKDAVSRKPSAIHSLLPLEQTPGVIPLLAGKPNTSTFPFLSFSFTAKDPHQVGEEVSADITGRLLSTGLQYGTTPGVHELITWFEGLQERVHGRKATGEGWRISIGCGSRELVSKAIRAFIEPGHSVLVDSDSEKHLDQIPIFQIHPCDVVSVPTDNNGIIPSGLREILQDWSEACANPRPKVLYTIPVGVGPETSLERRNEILKIAKEWDIIILEDDPYYYLARTQTPSYFSVERSLEQVGRVIRFDTLSKVIAPGLSIGWVSGPEVLVGAIDTITSTANLQAATVSQAVALALLEAWQYDGFLRHAENVADFYQRQLILPSDSSGLATTR